MIEDVQEKIKGNKSISAKLVKKTVLWRANWDNGNSQEVEFQFPMQKGTSMKVLNDILHESLGKVNKAYCCRIKLKK